MSRVQNSFHECSIKSCSKERIIIGDEIWVYGYAPETKAQSMMREESRPRSRPKKTHQSWSNVKAMLIVFFDHQDIIYHKYALQGRNKYRILFEFLNDYVTQ